MPCIAISLHTLCSNHGIISFPIVKLTILGGHDPALAPKIWAHVLQNCILDDTCGQIGDLLGPFLTQFNVAKTSIFSHTAANEPFFCAPKPCIAISLHTWCSNTGIISFPTVKLTIPGGHDLVLAPKTDLTRRILCPAGPYWGPKIHPVGPFLTHFLSLIHI